jgi:multicomponent Na+:H+ antiporter subunit B
MGPVVQIFALSGLAPGHYSPGGGFQGGVLLAASFILVGLSRDLRTVEWLLAEKKAILTAAAGVCIYAGTGLWPFSTGATSWTTGASDRPSGRDPGARSMGILCGRSGWP